MFAGLTLVLSGLVGCQREQRMTVTATAFNSTRAQTDRNPSIAACGNRIAPGHKIVAVSRDLEALGLSCGREIRIHGMEGTWTVVDRTAADRTRQIDIYMGRDVQAAREWGVQEVEITWRE